MSGPNPPIGVLDAILQCGPLIGVPDVDGPRQAANEALGRYCVEAAKKLDSGNRTNFSKYLQPAAWNWLQTRLRLGPPSFTNGAPKDDEAAFRDLKAWIRLRAINEWRKANPEEARRLRHEDELAKRASLARVPIEELRAREAVQRQERAARRRPQTLDQSLDWDIVELGRQVYEDRIAPLLLGGSDVDVRCHDDLEHRRTIREDAVTYERYAASVGLDYSASPKTVRNYEQNRFRLAMKRVLALAPQVLAEDGEDSVFLETYLRSLKGHR